MVGASGPLHDAAAVRVEKEETARRPPEQPFSWRRIRHLRPSDAPDLPAPVVLVDACHRPQVSRVEDDVVVEVDDDRSGRDTRSEVTLPRKPGSRVLQCDTAARHGLGETIDGVQGWRHAGIDDHDFAWAAYLALERLEAGLEHLRTVLGADDDGEGERLRVFNVLARRFSQLVRGPGRVSDRPPDQLPQQPR